MSKYMPEANRADNFNVYGYTVGATLAQVLKQCGDNLTRENVMRQAASVKNLRLETLLPGILISTGPEDYAPLEAVQLQRFTGKQWELFGDVMTSSQ
jgi:branched-chain amino acid transport system substrate-binding protein